MKISFIGGGSFGSSLASSFVDKTHDIIIYDRNKDTVNEINNKHTNSKYLNDIKLGENIRATDSLKNAIENSQMIVFAVPSHAVSDICDKIKEMDYSNKIIVSVAKGIDPKSLKPLSEVIEEKLNIYPVILSGPSHAEEIAMKLPTTLVSSSKNRDHMLEVQKIFSNEKLRVYHNSDLRGIEIGGAVKNIIALAAGISDGIGYGDNAKAALMTRGMAEIIKIGTHLGAEKETFYGLTGMGDLIVTCTSMHSRNRRAGILIGQGISLDEVKNRIGMIIEGVNACISFNSLSKNNKIEMPITEAVYSILFENVTPKEAVKTLMLRELKME